MAKRVELAYDLGEDWIIDFQACMSDGVTPMPLPAGSDVVFRMGARGQTYLVEAKAGTGVTLAADAATSGKVLIAIRAPAQHTVPPGVYGYTIRAMLADGSISDQAYGPLEIRGTEFGQP